MRLTLAVAIAATVSSAAAFTVHAFAHDKCEDTAANDQKYLAAGAAVSPVSGLGLVDGLALGVQSYCVDVSKVGVAEALSVAVGLRKDDETEDSIRTLRVFSDQGCQTALIALKTTATPATTATTAACAAPNSIAAGAGVCACVGLNTAARGSQSIKSIGITLSGDVETPALVVDAPKAGSTRKRSLRSPLVGKF